MHSMYTHLPCLPRLLALAELCCPDMRERKQTEKRPCAVEVNHVMCSVWVLVGAVLLSRTLTHLSLGHLES